MFVKFLTVQFGTRIQRNPKYSILKKACFICITILGLITYEMTANTATLNFPGKPAGNNDTDNYMIFIPDNTDSSRGAHKDFTVDRLLDTDPNTIWYSNGGTNGEENWVEYMYNEPILVKQVLLRSVNKENSKRRDPKKFTIIASNDRGNWVELYRRDLDSNLFGAPLEEKIIDISENITTYKYYRLSISLNSNNSVDQVSELDQFFLKVPLEGDVYTGLDTNSDVMVADADAISTLNTGPLHTVDQLTDNNPDTFWRSGTYVIPTNPNWVRYEYSSPVVVDQLIMTSTNDADRDRDPKNFRIEASNDNNNWEILYTKYNEEVLFTAAGEEKRFRFSNTQQYTYYRVVITEMKSQEVFSLGYISMAELHFAKVSSNTNDPDPDDPKNTPTASFWKAISGRDGIYYNSGKRVEITGTLFANNLIAAKDVAMPWPDYVFETDYNLKPLEEVEQFIKSNKHLPEVPSAAQIGKEGVNLGKMDAVLLRKVEELTLYIITQNKQLARLQERIAELEARKSK